MSHTRYFLEPPLHETVPAEAFRSETHTRALPRLWGTSFDQQRKDLKAVTYELARDLAVAALILRAFGRDAIGLLRRAAAAGVRAGVTELHRERTGGQQ